MPWATYAAVLYSRRDCRRHRRLVHHRAGQRCDWRCFFKAFNALFDRVVAIYGRVVGGLLRISVLALVVYVRPAWCSPIGNSIARRPGFIPQQDKGYLLLNVQLPDSASVERTEAIMARIEEIAHETPGVEHTVGISGQSLILNANAPNLGLDVRDAQAV